MSELTFGWFDLIFWLVALAVAFYVSFVLDPRKLFFKDKKHERGTIKGPKDEEPDKLKLQKFYACILYNSESETAEKLALGLQNESKTRNVPFQTCPLETFNFDALDHFKNDYPIAIIVDGECAELESFFESCRKDDSKARSYRRAFLSNISFSVYAVKFKDCEELSAKMSKLGAKSFYTPKKSDDFSSWKQHLFSNLTAKKYK